MKKNLQTAFSTRQYMLSKDFEVYYYSDFYLSQVKDHAHDYYEFYFFLEPSLTNPRNNANSTAMPTAGVTKFCTVRPMAWEK